MIDPQINKWYLGIDLGTGSCKTVVINEGANVLGFGIGEYLSQGVDSKWQEQDPQAILDGMINSVSAALTNAGNLRGECGGLSIGGALHGIMAIDRHGNPLTGLITWADGRAAEQAQKLKNTSQDSDIYQKTGCPIHGMYPLYKIIWLRENRPDIFQKAARFISAKEYVFARMTGQFWVDYGLASGSGLLNTHTLQWDSDALALAGIQTDHLSELHSPRKIHHGVNPELASKMGISPETVVVLGSSDAANSSMGAGAVHPWQATLMVGTSGAYRVVSPKPVLDDQARSWCYSLDETHWLVGGSINNAGLALSWWRDAVNHSLANTDNPQLSFGDFLTLANQVNVGSEGVLCLPFLTGERSPHWNQNARAAFFGLALEHDTRHMTRALLEGVAFRFCSLGEVMYEIGMDLREVRTSGGITKSPLWLEIMASALNRPLNVPNWGETSSLGAAFWVLLSTGSIKSVEDLSGLVSLGAPCQPDSKDAEVYNNLYQIFTSLYQAVESSFDAITNFQRKVVAPSQNK